MKRFWTSAVTALVVIAGLVFVSGSWISATGHAGMTGPMTMAGNPQPMLTASTADSFTPKMAPLSRAGWTVVASGQSSSHPVRSAIDSKQATFWHSTSSPLPHRITINLHATRYVSALTYLPRQGTSSNGNIGRYSISVSMNGKNWGAPVVTGTWADDKSRKTAVFSTVKEKLGKVKSRQLHAAAEENRSNGRLPGHSFVLTYDTKFERGEGMETFTLVEHNGHWLLAKYFVNSTGLQ